MWGGVHTLAMAVSIRNGIHRLHNQETTQSHGGKNHMRVFSIGSDDQFTEYKRLPFEADHEERVLEKWLEDNPDGILENPDGIQEGARTLLIIGRQVRTDLGGFIDLLGVDLEGNTVVIELKRDSTPRVTLPVA